MNHAGQAMQKRVEMLEVMLVRTAVLMEALESSACAFAFDLGLANNPMKAWDEAVASVKPKEGV